MSDISLPHSFSAATTIISAQVNANFAAITSVVNGSLDDTNFTTLTGPLAWTITSNVKALDASSSGTAALATFSATGVWGSGVSGISLTSNAAQTTGDAFLFVNASSASASIPLALLKNSGSGDFLKCTNGAGTTKFKVDSTGAVTGPPTISRTGGVGVQGTNTNDDAAAGYIGEYAAASRIESARSNMATATATNVTASALSLTAGDWDVDGTIVFYSNSNSITRLAGAISKTSATFPANDTNGVPTSGESHLVWDMPATLPGAGGKMVVRLPRTRVSLTATTSLYLVALAVYTAGTNIEFYGSITARRMR